MIAVDDKPTMIFRNPTKDMLTLSITGMLHSKLLFSVRFQSAAEIAELDRRIKEEAPKLRAAAEAKAAKEQGGRRVGRKKQGGESRRYPARGCDRREGDQGPDQVHCWQRESQSGRRVLAGTVSQGGLERKLRLIRKDERRALFLKRRRTECERHLHRHRYDAVGSQSIGDAGRTGSHREVRSDP